MGDLFVLLSDPDAELANWPLELAALRDKMHGDARSHLDKELPSLRDEVSAGEGDKWRQKRNNSFDQNRQLEEVTKERDALQHVASSLQHAVGQLVAYCASAEDELNRTVLARLLATLLPHEQSFLDDSRASSPNLSADLNLSTVSRSRHVHFAPELDGILAALDEEGAAGFLRHQRDLSADIKRELEISLLRLRNEANELLDLSARLAANKVQPQNKMLESSQVEITELEEDLEAEQKENCDNCELHKKTMEEAMSDCLHRESLLRSDLEAAMVKIAQLMSDRGDSEDVIAEGYGTCVASDARRAGASRSLDDASPRSQINSLARDLELLQHERDDLQQQLEAANRQLRSTRHFVEEQAAEREHERDEFAARLAELRDENARLAQRLHANARILAEVEQLETQTREMNQMISNLEARKASTDEELKSSEENVTLMRDIIANLENQLEQKTKREADVLEQLEGMKRTIDERDGKMRALLGELESLRSEKADQSEIVCENCAREEDKYTELLQKVNEQCRWLEGEVQARSRLVQRAHEQAEAACGDHSEDVSLADKLARAQGDGVEAQPADVEWVRGVGEVREALRTLARAEDAALKRIADLRMQRDQLHQVAQEVRCERDVLQARMSEQALRISSLSARLARQRHDADALALQARGDLGVQLHDANAEVQRLKEELESRDKQIARLRLHLEGRPRDAEQSAYGDTSCEERAEAEALASELEAAKERLEALSNQNRSLKEALAQRDRQLRELMALKLEEEEPYQRSEQPEGKVSARTLSDVVSISEFDEQDHQMRRAELIAQNISPAFNVREKSPNATLPPNPHHHMSSLNLDQHETIEFSPRAGSLPLHLTSTQNREQYKRNVNETTVFGGRGNPKEETQQRIQDNCSMYPNKDASDTKDVSVEPKKINFSLEAMDKTREEDIASLRELGVMLDLKQENFHDILMQLKNEVKRYRNELDNCKSELKNAEEQLCEFPALKEEVEELKGLLENTMATMESDKKFYENQLENFSSNKKLLEQRLAELTQEGNDKTKDLHLLKEDILRRENMILELAKEKRNLTNKLNELEVKIDELQSRNETLQKHEKDNHQMKEKIKELEKLEQLVSEKNQQIDSLNQHLDRFDDLQRTLNDKTEELENLKEALRQKSTELYQMQDTVTNLNRDVERVTNENRQLDDHNRELKLKMTKVEKEQENASLRLQNSENELERLNSANSELIAKLEEMQILKERLKEKEIEVESLRAQLTATPPRMAALRHELDFNRRELNDKAYELAKAKLDVTELRNSASEAAKQAADKEAANNELLQQTEALRREIQQLTDEKQQLAQQLEVVVARLREESNVSEIKTKLRERAESCHELEMELHGMRDMMESGSRGGARSPTAELERALRDQLHYSHALDDRIMDQILSASSDEHEHVPSLALDTSNTDKWSRASDGEWGSEALRVQVEHLRARLADKDALITELNRIRDQLVQDWQTVKLRYEAERDNSGRLQLLLDSQKETAESLQSQDANMIQILKKRLESAMQSESELLERERALRRRLARLEATPAGLASPTTSPQASRHDPNNESESVERLKGEVTVLRTRLETERERYSEAQAQLQLARRQLDERQREAAKLRAQLAELKRLKQESGEQLARANELLATQATAVADLERKLGTFKQRLKNDSMTEVEKQSPLREMAPDAAALHAELRALRRDLAARSQQNTPIVQTDDKDQAIRYLNARCLRLESWRKALVWQKRYLQRELAGYARLERSLALQAPHHAHLVLAPHPRSPSPRPTGKKLFKCVVTVVVTVLRMEFLVRRRQYARAASACLVRTDNDQDNVAARQNITGTPLLSPRGVLARRLRLAPQSPLAVPSPRQPRTPLTPLTPLGALRTVEDEGKRSPGVNSPRSEFYLLSSPRSDMASGYLGKLQAVGRCLSRPEGPADVP